MQFSRLSQGIAILAAASLSVGLLLTMGACRAAIGLDELSFGPSAGTGGMDGLGGGSASSSSSATSSSSGTGGTMNTGPVCGNGALETNEICDDGNTQDGDGCASNCRCAAPDGASKDMNFVFASADGKTCYVLFNGLRSFNEAQNLCQSNSMYLASVTSKAELDWIHPFIEPYNRIWIGGARGSAMFDAWTWVSGEPWLLNPCDASQYPLCDDTVNLWSQGEPNNTGGVEDCVEIYHGDAVGFNDVICSDSLVYLCERPL